MDEGRLLIVAYEIISVNKSLLITAREKAFIETDAEIKIDKNLRDGVNASIAVIDNNLTRVARDQSANALDDTEMQSAYSKLGGITPINANDISFLAQYAQAPSNITPITDFQPLTLSNSQDNSLGRSW